MDQRETASDLELSCRIHQLLEAEHPFGRVVGRLSELHHQCSCASAPGRVLGRFYYLGEDSDCASNAEVTRVELEFIRELASNAPVVGYNRWPKFRGMT